MRNSISPLHNNISPSWQQELAHSFSNLNELFVYLGLDPSKLASNHAAAANFPFKVTRSFASRIEKGNINDPLLRQIMPLQDELVNRSDFVDNPVGDFEAIAVPGVLHKYESRALLIASGGCAINCRYCFRRNFPYSEAQLSKQRKRLALDYIGNHKDITEIILSGGDPLILSNKCLDELIDEIAAIDHVRRLRIHTRLPCVLPSRISAGLIKLLSDSRLNVVFVVHINHPNEINSEVEQAISKLTRAGIPVFNQAVLLYGVNDNLKTLASLFETLFDAGIFPYYMHILDKTKGTQHFEVTNDRIRDLQDAIRRKLPGYLIPRFVKEQAGKPYKIPI